MSFLDRIKSNSRNQAADPAPSGSFDDRSGPPSNPMEATARLGHSTLTPPHTGRMDAADSSIISEAAPSELAADYTEAHGARLASSDGEGETFNSGLPVVGTIASAPSSFSRSSLASSSGFSPTGREVRSTSVRVTS